MGVGGGGAARARWGSAEGDWSPRGSGDWVARWVEAGQARLPQSSPRFGSTGCQKHRCVPRAKFSPSGPRKSVPGSPDLFSVAGCTANDGLALCARAGLRLVYAGSHGPRLVLGTPPGDPLGSGLAAV